MIISDSYKFIFIAVPKTATSSIENALSSYGDIELAKSFGKHIKAAELKNQLGEEKWKSYYKFAFVRHPLDWMASWYTYRTRKALLDPNHPNHDRSTVGMTFREFLDRDMAELEDGNLQCDYIMDEEDNQLLDFVGKYETLQKDFETVCNAIGITPISLMSANRSPEGSNSSTVYDDKSRERVLTANQREMRLLSYAETYSVDTRKGRTTAQFLAHKVKHLFGKN